MKRLRLLMTEATGRGMNVLGNLPVFITEIYLARKISADSPVY